MKFTCLLILMVICVTLTQIRALTRDEIYRLVSAGIPGVRHSYQNTGYRPQYPGYRPSPYGRPAPGPSRSYPTNSYKYIPQYPPYPPRLQAYVPPPPAYSNSQRGGAVQPQNPVQNPARASRTCEIDPSAIYQLATDDRNYPVSAIKEELARQPSIKKILMSMMIDRPYQSNSGGMDLSTCKTTLTPLASFYSSEHGNQCWVLRDVQERIEVANCRHGPCNSCSPVVLPGLQAMCTTNFRYVSVWAYCENVQQGSPIIHTRLVVPAFCSCKHRTPC